MKTTTKRQRRSLALKPTAFMAGSASAMFLFMLSPMALAQQADAPKPAQTEAEKQAADKAKKEKDAKLETVTVTGIRRGIQQAISVKKNADAIVEAISAEDIGKLPDSSVAESISRLPGVSAQRTAGRAQQISIRGMAPDFSTALLNGREQVTTGDSRGVEFDQYPSELLSGVVIYKTPDGALLGQGLSGTVDLQTVRPLAFGKRTLAVNVRGQRTGVGTEKGKDAEGDGDRVSFSYVDQFADRTIGLSLGYARFKENGAKTQRFDSWGSAERRYNAATGALAATDAAGNTDPIVSMPNGFNRFEDQTKQTREGFAGTLQFKPNQDFESVLDLFYSKFDIDKSTKGFQAPIPGGAGGYDRDATTLTNATVVNGVVQAGTFNNFKGVVRNDSESTQDETTSIGWNNKLRLGEWTAAVDLSRSKAERSGGIIETTAGVPGNGVGLDTISYTGFNGNNHSDVVYKTGFNYADPNVARLTDVQGWGGGPNLPQAGYSKLPHVTDTLNAIRLSGRKDLGGDGMFTGINFGLNVTDREKVREYVEGRLVIPGTDPFASVVAPGAGSTTVAGIPVMTWDPRGSVGSVYQVAAKLVRDIANKDWTVNEKVTTLYSKADLESQLMGLPMRGNLGLQVVNTDQSSKAYNIDGGPCPGDVCVLNDVTGGKKYTDLLPSMNLAFDLGNDQALRFGLARTMARPTLADMRASLGFSVTTVNGNQTLSGDAGNPELNPFRANALDVSYEKYFGNKGYVGAAAFHKDLRSYIVKTTSAFDYAPFVTAGTPLPTTGPNAGSTIGQLTRPENGEGGRISGLELSASLPFDMITPWLSGFGVVGNYANTSSSVKLPTSGVATNNISGPNIPLPGLSKHVGSVSVYYENSGFSIRYANRYRSDFIGEISDFTGDRQLTFIKGERVADLQLGYEIQSGMFKGLSALFQVLNLNNADFVRYKDTPDNVVERVKYGKTYLFGLNYKL